MMKRDQNSEKKAAVKEQPEGGAASDEFEVEDADDMAEAQEIEIKAAQDDH